MVGDAEAESRQKQRKDRLHRALNFPGLPSSGHDPAGEPLGGLNSFLEPF